ncbi:hypothetical protein FF2_012702 [Malus domestica]
MPSVSSETGQSFDLNSEPTVVEGLGSGVAARGEEFEESIREVELGGEAKGMEDDPFELAPIIEAVTKENKGKKKPSMRWYKLCQLIVWSLNATNQRKAYLLRRRRLVLRGLPRLHEANHLELSGYRE